MTRIVAAFSAGWIAFFGAWAALAMICTALGLGLAVTTPLVGMALLAGIVAGWSQSREAPAKPAEARPVAPSRAVLGLTIAAALLMAALPFAGREYSWIWAAALLPLLSAVLLDAPAGAAPEMEEPDFRWAPACLVAAAILALVMVIFSNRPSLDDDRYLWMALHLVRHPDDPIFDLLTIAPGREEIYAWHPHEILLAALSRLTGIGVPYHYDYTLPVIGALLIVSEFHLCARLFVGRLAALTTLLCVVLLVVWGDTHQAPGNFALVRLFDGKSMLASWAVPAVIRHGVLFARGRSARSGSMLAAAVLSGIAQSHAALAIAPLAALTGLFAGWPSRSRLAGPLAVLALALLGYTVLEAGHQILPFILTRKPASPADVFPMMFPPGYRSALALASVALAGILLAPGPARMARRAAFVGLALTFNPFVMSFLSVAIWSLSWRVLWAFPVVLFTGIVLTAGAAREIGAWRMPALSAATLAAFLIIGLWTISPRNGNNFGDPGLKIDQTQRDWLDSGSDVLLPKRR